jgi:FlaA1/EpsC-like NDP-sugar epimerase
LKSIKHVLLLKALIDILAGGLLCSPLAFLLRLEWTIDGYIYTAMVYTGLSILALSATEYFFRLPWRSWRSSSMRDLEHLFKALLFYSLLLTTIMFLMSHSLRIPRSVPIIDGFLTFLALGGLRFGARHISERNCKSLWKGPEPKRVLIVGAGEAGIMIAREMFRHPESGLRPVGFVDDDPSKQKTVMAGLHVLGHIEDLAEISTACGAEEVLISIPSAEGLLVRRIVELARKAKVDYRIIPGIYEVLSGAVNISHIRNVDVADLLGRDQVSLDINSISRYITGKRVLVTGAGGSIGSEIVRQVCGFAPSLIIMLGRGENSLFEAEHSLNGEFPDVPRETVVADVRDKQKIRMVFEKHRPQVIFHAAAHKHVPMMEKNPDQAILNNIGGTKVMAETALEFGVESFVNISTDKAVNPTSVMGATKRVAEMVVRDASSRAPENCSFVSVRFGNVLGSRGSVIPLFKEQIKRGGPVTVTHPEMTRYFMTIPEASQLVLQAAAMDGSGSVYVLDMGKPVKIKDLAEDLIQLSGFEPHVDIEITYTGIRPGEKLFEEILTSEEGTTGTRHDKIYVSPQKDLPPSFGEKLDALLASASRADDLQNLRQGLRDIVPAFRNENANDRQGSTP